MKYAINKEIIIRLGGDTDDDIEVALEEALRLIKDGFSSGFDSNESGFYRMDVNEPVEEDDLLAAEEADY